MARRKEGRKEERKEGRKERKKERRKEGKKEGREIGISSTRKESRVIFGILIDLYSCYGDGNVALKC